MTAQPYDQVIADSSLLSRDGASLRLRGAALLTVLVILALVAGAVLATAEWIAPASAGAVSG